MFTSKQMIMAAALPLSLFLSVSTFARGSGASPQTRSVGASMSAHQSGHMGSANGFGRPVYGHQSPRAGAGFHTAANTNSNGRFAVDRDKGPARAADRMSANGRRNTNGLNAIDRDKGRARAKDRRDHDHRIARQDRHHRDFRDRHDQL